MTHEQQHLTDQIARVEDLELRAYFIEILRQNIELKQTLAEYQELSLCCSPFNGLGDK